MDRAEIAVRKMLSAIEAPLYDVGVLSERGMLPGLDGISAEAVLAKLSLLKYRNARGSHIHIRPSGEHRFTVLDDLNEASLAGSRRMVSTPVPSSKPASAIFRPGSNMRLYYRSWLEVLLRKLLARRYDADLSAAGWRRFGRLPGFTNCKPKYRKADGLFPFVRLISHTGQQYPMAEAFHEEITKLYEAEEQKREVRWQRASLSPQRGGRSCLWSGSVPRPNTPIDRLRRTSPSVSQLSPMA